MDAFTQLEGMTAPLDRANVDTDQIIPKQYLKSIKRTGFGDYLFDAWRFLDQGTMGVTPNERQINHEFVLNLPQYQGASILLARDNFGTPSGRLKSLDLGPLSLRALPTYSSVTALRMVYYLLF